MCDNLDAGSGCECVRRKLHGRFRSWPKPLQSRRLKLTDLDVGATTSRRHQLWWQGKQFNRRRSLEQPTNSLISQPLRSPESQSGSAVSRLRVNGQFVRGPRRQHDCCRSNARAVGRFEMIDFVTASYAESAKHLFLTASRFWIAFASTSRTADQELSVSCRSSHCQEKGQYDMYTHISLRC